VIEAAYRRLALKYHPDVSDAPDAAERMRDLNMAYEVLSSSGKRAEYDRRRAAARPDAVGSQTAPVRRSYGPRPRLSIEPESLQFGPLPKGSTQTAQLHIVMEGMGSLRGSVRPNQTWLRTSVAEAEASSCTVEVTVDTAGLRDGWRHVGSVTIGTVLGSTRTIPVTVFVAPEPRPAVRVEPEVVDFGTVYGQPEVASQQFVVRNGGTGLLSGHVSISHSWLQVQPERFSSNEQSFTVQVDLRKLKPGRRYTGRLLLETNGGVAHVPVRVRVSEIVHPLPPPDSEEYWRELIRRLCPVEKWERDLVADLSLRAQQRGWVPSEQQIALIARIRTHGLKD